MSTHIKPLIKGTGLTLDKISQIFDIYCYEVPVLNLFDFLSINPSFIERWYSTVKKKSRNKRKVPLILVKMYRRPVLVCVKGSMIDKMNGKFHGRKIMYLNAKGFGSLAIVRGEDFFRSEVIEEFNNSIKKRKKK